MKKRKFKLFIYLLAGATLYAACRKTDRVAEGPPPVNVEEKFFSAHASNDPLVQSLTKKMQLENQQRPFIETIIRQIGYPQWDKSMIISKQDIPASGRNSTGDSVDIVYIPFVRNSENYVNASLLFKVSPSDTAYQYLLDWEYESYGFDSTGEDWNARDVFHLFAHFDREVFSRTTFRITDERIFGVPEGQERYVKLRPQQGTGQRQNILVYTTICDEVDHCYAPPGESPCAECTTNCPQYIYTTAECTTAWVEDGWVPAGGGSTGTGGTGGGSTGGSGGYPPPECPSVATRNGVVPNCGPGWIPPEGGGAPSANQNIIDSLQGYPCAQGVLAQMPSCNAATDSILSQIFGKNDKVNVIFKADSTLPPEVNGKTRFDSVTFNANGTINFIINLNANLIRTGSKEFIAKTMIHESVHAYINYYYLQYLTGVIDSNQFKIRFPKVWQYQNKGEAQHEEMVLNYFSTIKSFIQGYSPGIVDSVRSALAWNGLTRTKPWLNLGADTTRIRGMFAIARFGTIAEMAAYGLHKCK